MTCFFACQRAAGVLAVFSALALAAVEDPAAADAAGGVALMLLQTANLMSQTSAGASARLHLEDRHASIAQTRWDDLSKIQNLAVEQVDACPTTYIYDIPELWDLPVPLSEARTQAPQLLQDVWGEQCGNESGTFNINQFDMPAIVIYRLLSSSRCKVTTNPEEADLLLVPYWPRAKPGNMYCVRGAQVDPLPYLTHLTEENAHKHLFLLGKGHTLLKGCGPWWWRPPDLLRRAIRVTYSYPVRDLFGSVLPRYGPPDSRDLTLPSLAAMAADVDDDWADYPHTFSVPYPSTGALGTLPVREPWRDSESPRPILSYFMGGLHGKYGKDVRAKIIADCGIVGTPTCVHIRAHYSDNCEGMETKQQALFCLEPGGDTPYRKSVYDDLASGCVPVLFSPYMQLVSPWHWGHFRNDSHVYINRDDYLEGKVDLFAELRKIAESPRMQELRRSIANHAHATQYSQRDHPGDAVERLLVGAQRAAQQWELANKPTPH